MIGKTFALSAAALLLGAASTSLFAAAEPTFHWKEDSHSSTGPNSWTTTQYWAKGGVYPQGGLVKDVKANFFTLPPGPIINVYDGPGELSQIMFMQKVMDNMMNMLAMRGTEQLSSVRTLWELEHQYDFANGVVFNLLEHRVQTTDGYDGSLASPLVIPLTLVSMTPSGGPGGGGGGGSGGIAGLVNPQFDLVYSGVVPIGGLNFMVLDPATGATSPTLYTNDQPFDFEFTITVPEPGVMGMLATLGAAGFVRRSRSGSRSKFD